MLLQECAEVGVQLQLNTVIDSIQSLVTGFQLSTMLGEVRTESLVVATGGLSIPKMGASPLGYKIAEQFGLPVVSTRPGLVPLTLHVQDKALLAPLSGIAVPCRIQVGTQHFTENLLFTHRGLSGPCILQISSYWQPGDALHIDLWLDEDLALRLSEQKAQQARCSVKTFLAERLPKRLLSALLPETLLQTPLAQLSEQQLQLIATQVQQWIVKPNATEGYRTAEVTVGGVDCHALSSKTMSSRAHPQLYFVGEVVDVTGWLGGYNFQWAWASGWCAGQYA
jgi:predicted Rossmann fold flavoprotein